MSVKVAVRTGKDTSIIRRSVRRVGRRPASSIGALFITGQVALLFKDFSRAHREYRSAVANKSETAAAKAAAAAKCKAAATIAAAAAKIAAATIAATKAAADVLLQREQTELMDLQLELDETEVGLWILGLLVNSRGACAKCGSIM